MKLRYKIWMDQDGKVFGEGPYLLLKGIQTYGSLSKSAQKLKMSYSQAHTLMKTLGRKLGYPLIESQVGGKGGGITTITPEAIDLMNRYDAFMKEISVSMLMIFDKYFSQDQETKDQKDRNDQELIFELNKGVVQPQDLKLSQVIKIKNGSVIALVGGGGKTSIMYALANELVTMGKKVIVVTTTHIFLPEQGAVDRLLISLEEKLLDEAKASLQDANMIALTTGIEKGKLLSVSNKLVCQLAKSKIADCIIVEADGAARKPFKAPASYEPVIPSCANIVFSVVGIDAACKPLRQEYYHRVEEISKLTGLNQDDIVSPAAIAEVLTSNKGGKKNVPTKAKWIPVINKIDTSIDRENAIVIAKELEKKGVEEVLFSSVHNGLLKVELWKNQLEEKI